MHEHHCSNNDYNTYATKIEKYLFSADSEGEQKKSCLISQKNKI